MASGSDALLRAIRSEAQVERSKPNPFAGLQSILGATTQGILKRREDQQQNEQLADLLQQTTSFGQPTTQQQPQLQQDVPQLGISEGLQPQQPQQATNPLIAFSDASIRKNEERIRQLEQSKIRVTRMFGASAKGKLVIDSLDSQIKESKTAIEKSKTNRIKDQREEAKQVAADQRQLDKEQRKLDSDIQKENRGLFLDAIKKGIPSSELRGLSPEQVQDKLSERIGGQSGRDLEEKLSEARAIGAIKTSEDLQKKSIESQTKLNRIAESLSTFVGLTKGKKEEQGGLGTVGNIKGKIGVFVDNLFDTSKFANTAAFTGQLNEISISLVGILSGQNRFVQGLKEAIDETLPRPGDSEGIIIAKIFQTLDNSFKIAKAIDDAGLTDEQIKNMTKGDFLALSNNINLSREEALRLIDIKEQISKAPKAAKLQGLDPENIKSFFAGQREVANSLSNETPSPTPIPRPQQTSSEDIRAEMRRRGLI